VSEISIKNQDAEIAVLGSVLIDSNVIKTLQNILKPEDFYAIKHQNIFRTMVDMESKGIPVDIVTLSSELSSKGWLDDIGGHNYLMYLIELTPSSANCEYYAKKVKEASRLRKISEFSQRIKQDIDEGETDFLTARNSISDFYDDISKEDIL